MIRPMRSGMVMANAIMPTTAPTPRMPRGSTGAPPAKRTTAAAAITNMAAPRSGCRMSSRTGNDRMSMGRSNPCHGLDILSFFICTHRAQKITVASLRNSAGWIANGPSGIQRADPFTVLPIPGIRQNATRIVAPTRIQRPRETRTFGSSRLSAAHTPTPTTSQSPCLWRKKRGWPRFSGENAPTLASMIRPSPTKPTTQAIRVYAALRPIVSSTRVSEASPCPAPRPGPTEPPPGLPPSRRPRRGPGAFALFSASGGR